MQQKKSGDEINEYTAAQSQNLTGQRSTTKEFFLQWHSDEGGGGGVCGGGSTVFLLYSSADKLKETLIYPQSVPQEQVEPHVRPQTDVDTHFNTCSWLRHHGERYSVFLRQFSKTVFRKPLHFWKVFFFFQFLVPVSQLRSRKVWTQRHPTSSNVSSDPHTGPWTGKNLVIRYTVGLPGTSLISSTAAVVSR